MNDVSEKKNRRYEANVRAYVFVEIFSGVGAWVNIETVRYEYPGFQRKIIDFELSFCFETHFEFKRELIVYFGLDIDHKQML